MIFRLSQKLNDKVITDVAAQPEFICGLVGNAVRMEYHGSHRKPCLVDRLNLIAADFSNHMPNVQPGKLVKRIVVEFSGGKMNGQRYDTEADDKADREAAIALFEKTGSGKEGAVEFSRPAMDDGKWQRYQVTRRLESDERISVRLTYSAIQ